MKIEAANIADLSEIPLEYASPTKHTSPRVEPSTTTPYSQPSSKPPSQPSFVDPAILSVGKRPSSITPSTSGPQYQSDKANNISQGGSRQEQDILGSIQNLKVEPSPADSYNGKPETPSQKKKGRSRQSKQAKSTVSVLNAGQEGDGAGVQGNHGQGWRQTPILQSNSSFQPFSSLKRLAKSKKGFTDNGWASEDVTEEMGEFDFENNLAKFDKRTVFDQLRREDEIDEADRLVTHNRRPMPGTAGGKNYHYTEMVLEPPPKLGQNADFWNSEADVGVNESERLSGREQPPVQGTKRADSKSGPSRRSQSRKASGVIVSRPLSRVSSFVRLSQSPRWSSTPRPGHREADRKQQRVDQPGLYLIPSNRRLEAISTLQMLNLENIAANEIGFTETLMAENAGRGIAEVAVMTLSDPAMKVRFELAIASSSVDASLDRSTIVILAGNNKSGIRALAAGRHLRNKNFDILVCLVGVEREKDLLEELRRQIQLYRAFGGKVLNKNDFFEHLRKSSAAGTPASVSLIIDALLGLTISFEELRIGDQATVYELMEWANRNEAFVLSVDVPTGIDPTTGKIAIIDGSQLYVKPRYVVAIGAPKKGLLEAVTPPAEGEPGTFGEAAHDDEWRLFIADMGLGSAVWRKAGTKVRKGIDFDGSWVLQMRYRGVEVDYEEE